MTTLLPRTRQRRKTKIGIFHAELQRSRRATNWRVAVRIGGKRTQYFDTGTPLESAAREFAALLLRNLTRPDPRPQTPDPRPQTPDPRPQTPDPRPQSLLM